MYPVLQGAESHHSFAPNPNQTLESSVTSVHSSFHSPISQYSEFGSLKCAKPHNIKPSHPSLKPYTVPRVQVDHALVHLRLAFGAKAVPTPVATHVSSWRNDRWTRGAYSVIGLGASPDDMVALGETVGESLFWAGEATSEENAATVRAEPVTQLPETKAAQRVLVHFFCCIPPFKLDTLLSPLTRDSYGCGHSQLCVLCECRFMARTLPDWKLHGR